MRGVAAHYPGFETGRAAPVNLEQRINICRAERQKATPFRFESKDLLALAAYLGFQSRGIPIDVVVDERMQSFLEAGRAMFTQRQGQLNLSCAQCHDDNWGQKLAGAPIPQAPHRISDLSPGVAIRRIVATATAKLPDRDACRVLSLWCARVCGS
jgi:sulfur-oxidizing protein SoxA